MQSLTQLNAAARQEEGRWVNSFGKMSVILDQSGGLASKAGDLMQSLELT